MQTLDAADVLRPELTALNRLPMRSPLAFFGDADAALAGRRPRRRLSLDGDWAFELFDAPQRAWDAVAAGLGTVTEPDRTVPVPGCWTMQPDIDDHPHYTNIIMPWPGLEAPETPEHNPTGVYATSFDLPKSWLADDVMVHLGGFESVAVVWCNGVFVGMAKDSRLASEFVLNDAAQAGANQLVVLVIRYSDATWIEDQDHWWHGGLHRSVFVEARPRRRVDDVAVTSDYDAATGVGSVRVDTHVCGRSESSVRVTVHDENGPVATGEARVPMVPDGPPLQQLVSSYEYPGRVATVQLDVDACRAWTAETPHLYEVVVELIDERNRVTMATKARTGFRRVEVRDRRFLVNDTPIVFHGVNRHDHHPDTGKVLTEQDLLDDLLTMKAHNINAVRCAHYPNDPRLLDLCDELGLWVIDEANVECHARLRSVSDDPRYLPAIVDRVSRMVVRDRNHPSVVVWSLGNESGHGTAQDAAAAWVRATDPSRPVHYEGAIQQRFVIENRDVGAVCTAPSRRERLVTDLVCPMYTDPSVVEGWAEWAEKTGLDDRPLMLCEYSHAMGNSNGGFARYAEAFHRFPALAGGFIWDWKDQGLRSIDAAGNEFWAYGGHFGDEPNDANFCINGLVGPDGAPHPGLREVKWGYQPVRVTSVQGRTVRIENRRAFTDLNDLEGVWKLVDRGEVVEVGVVDADPPPGRSERFAVPFTTKLPRGGDVVLRFEWTAVATSEVVAIDEVALREPADVDLAVLDDARLRDVRPVASSGGSAVGSTAVEWDDVGPHSIVVAGHALSGWLEPCLWRATVDNDGVAQGWMSEVNGVRPRWVSQGIDRLSWRVDGVQVLHGDDVSLVVVDRLPVGHEDKARWSSRLVIGPTSLVVDESVHLDAEWSDLPRIGSGLTLPASLGNLRWFGRGPHESYVDRKASAPLGVWASTVDEQYHDYVVPQEHAAHADTRWFELTDDQGSGLRFELSSPISFSARRHDDAVLTEATTTAMLRPTEGIDVHLDVAQRGLGTGACGPDAEHHARTAAGEHRWRFTISEVRP